MTEWWRQSALGLATAIRNGAATSREVVEAHLERIEAVNPRLNAITTLLADEAAQAADAADAALAAGHEVGPLHGVPITVKQNIDLVGSATNQGIVAFAELLPAADSPVVERMKRAGAIPIGRTNCPDMGLRIHTDSGLFGLTRNPWHPERTTGGSSGGEAASLATGMSPLGLGNDVGGSLRNPANCCGIASIKPSAGVVPAFTSIPLPDLSPAIQTMVVEGPMARRVADVRAALQVLAGRDGRDPASTLVGPLPERPPSDRPLRAAILPEPPGGITDPGVAATVRSAGDALAAAGYDVFEATPPRYEDVFLTWLHYLGSDITVARPLLYPLMNADAQVFLDEVDEALPALDIAGLAQLLTTRQQLQRAWSAWFAETAELLVTPTWTELPFAHGADVAPGGPMAVLTQARPVFPGNLLGIPSACVPAGLVEGLPVGVLVHADRFGDLSTLDAAEAIEAALGSNVPIDPVW